MERSLLVTLVGTAMVVGLAGTVIPVLPGLLLVWGAALLYGLTVGFDPLGWGAIGVITGLLVLGLIVSVRIPVRRAGEQGVTGWRRLIPLLMAVAGFFVIPVVGAAVGFVAGVLAAKWWETRLLSKAWSATIAVLAGLVHSAAAQLGVGLAMVAVWVLWVVIGR